MANYRKLVRYAIADVLASPTTGFNYQLAALASTYGIEPWEFDFGRHSRNVIYGFLDDEGIDVSGIFNFPGLVICTTEAIDEKKIRNMKFSGFVGVTIGAYLRLQALDAEDMVVNRPDFDGDLEKWADATEDALQEALYAGRGAFQTAGCNYTLFRSDRSPIVARGDGHTQSLTFQLGFEVHRQ